MTDDIGTAIVVLGILAWLNVLAYRVDPGRFMAPKVGFTVSGLATWAFGTLDRLDEADGPAVEIPTGVALGLMCLCTAWFLWSHYRSANQKP